MADVRDFLGIRVDKGFFQNLDTGDIATFLFNPSQVEERHSPKYVFHGSLGLSSERMQFVGNKNDAFSMDLIFDQLVYDRQRAAGELGIGAGDVEIWRRTLKSYCYPRRSQGLGQASPPPILFHWPGLLNIRVRLTDLTLRHVQFKSGSGSPRIMIASVVLTEEPCGRLFSEDMMRLGAHRPWGSQLECSGGGDR